MRRHQPQSPIQRLIEPEEIASMIIHLASATTAGAFRVDGDHVDGILL
jgi:NAD(P)-dependent dehydrogenase (short-subunit alcohol dehydrogenase family)